MGWAGQNRGGALPPQKLSLFFGRGGAKKRGFEKKGKRIFFFRAGNKNKRSPKKMMGMRSGKRPRRGPKTRNELFCPVAPGGLTSGFWGGDRPAALQRAFPKNAPPVTEGRGTKNVTETTFGYLVGNHGGGGTLGAPGPGRI